MDHIDDLNNGPISSKKGGKGKTPFLDQFGEDLTQMAAEGKLDAIIGLSLIHISEPTRRS